MYIHLYMHKIITVGIIMCVIVFIHIVLGNIVCTVTVIVRMLLLIEKL